MKRAGVPNIIRLLRGRAGVETGSREPSTEKMNHALFWGFAISCMTRALTTVMSRMESGAGFWYMMINGRSGEIGELENSRKQRN